MDRFVKLLFRGAWPYGLIWLLLWLGAGAAMTWLFGYALLSMLGGLIGFDEFWLLPLGVVVVALFAAALYVFRDPSPWRAVAIAAFGGLAVESWLALFAGDGSWRFLDLDVAGQVLLVGMLAVAVAGIAATVASWITPDPS